MEENPQVLLADVRSDGSKNLASLLGRAGMAVILFHDGRQVLQHVHEKSPDCLVVDVQLPGLNGRQILHRLRLDGNSVPVILMGEHGESPERAMALEEGADDYILKTWEPIEVLARIKAVLRRTLRNSFSSPSDHFMCVGDLRLDNYSRRVWVKSKEVYLTPRATAILEYFMRHPDKLISREELADAIWGWDPPVSLRAVDTRISELRRFLDSDAKN